MAHLRFALTTGFAAGLLFGCSDPSSPNTSSPSLATTLSAPTLTVQHSGTTQRLQAVSAVNRNVVWASGTGGTYAITRDGGATWHPFTVSDLQSANDDPMRAIALPSLDIDSNGTIYAAWHDCRFRPTCSGNDIVLSTSTDGTTWTAPLRVTRGQSSFIPGLAADPSNPGALALVYASFDAGKNLGISFTQSRDGGHTWTKAQRLDAQRMPMTWLPQAEGGRMVGDYFSVAYAAGRVVPVFALAAAPLHGRYREGIFAASLKPLG